MALTSLTVSKCARVAGGLKRIVVLDKDDIGSFEFDGTFTSRTMSKTGVDRTLLNRFSLKRRLQEMLEIGSPTTSSNLL